MRLLLAMMAVKEDLDEFSIRWKILREGGRV
jgi:hypothetical protein